MKLIYCPKCRDVVALAFKRRHCECGHVWGEYTDNLNARISYDAIALGFANSSLIRALEDKDKVQVMGTRFEAFVIPPNAPTVVRVKDKK